jgi:hypothetical protein
VPNSFHIPRHIIHPDNLNNNTETISDIYIEVLEIAKHLVFSVFHEIYPSHPRVTINEGDKVLHSTNRDHMRSLRVNQHKG